MSVQAVRTTSVVVLTCDAVHCHAKHHGPSTPSRDEALRRALGTARARGWVVTDAFPGVDQLHFCGAHGHLAPGSGR